jgi:hypothetical protein
LLVGLAVPCLAEPAAPPAGVCAAVRGQVDLEREATPWRAVGSGEEVMSRDELRSGPRSGLQLLLRDETVFTLGPDSAIRVDEFAYEPGAANAKLVANVTKGVFRFVSGKIPQQAPDHVQLGAGTGTIEIRGTMLAGRVDEVSGETLIVLLGEGAHNDTLASPAAIEVCNAGSCVDIQRAGYATRIAGPDAPPTPPFALAANDLSALLAGVAPPPVWALGDEGQIAEGVLPRAPAALAMDAETETVEDVLLALERTAFWVDNQGLLAAASQDARDTSEARRHSSLSTSR